MFAHSLNSGLIKGFGTYQVKDPVIITQAINNGYNLFDTAELYRNEKMVIDAIKLWPGKQLFVSTKISYIAIEKGQIEQSFYDRLEIFGGLKINCLLLHKPSSDCRRDWSILCGLYQKHRDLIDHIGVSNYDLKHLEQLDGMMCPFINQIELSPFNVRTELVTYCRSKGIMVVSHTTLTRGLMFNNPVILDLVDKYKTNAAKVFLTWALQNKYLTIPRTSKLEHLLENIKEPDFVFSDDDMKTLGQLDENFALTKVMF